MLADYTRQSVEPAVGEQAVHRRHETLRMRDGDVQRDLAEQAVAVQQRDPARQSGALDGEQLHNPESLPRGFRGHLWH